MGTRVQPGLHQEIVKFGGKSVTACMNCGNCTVLCPQSTDSASFPRKIIHLLQVGSRDRLRESLEPWLCYYCGDCSESCPRDANPAESMMAARRYLISEYDWTGIGRKLYMSPPWEVASIILVGLAVVALFYFFHGPMPRGHVELNTFAPVKWIELGDWIAGGILALLLLTNALRMYRFVMRSEGAAKIPLSFHVKKLGTFFTHFAVQKRWFECHGERGRWLRHLLLMSGYITMLLLVVVFLRWFQTDTVVPFYEPTRLLGYYATAVLLYASADFLIGRMKKRGQIHRFSELSDWLFLALMFLTALTGILVHAFRLADLPLATYYTYVVHLAVAAPFLIVEVPFGKWSHMLYRPLAVYLSEVKCASSSRREAQGTTGIAA